MTNGDGSNLGDRMKQLEHYGTSAGTEHLEKDSYAILRVDGRAFHSYLKYADKPFDLEFTNAMAEVTTALCEEIQGAKLAYTQSDEISVLFTDLTTPQAEYWMGGDRQKIVSLSASLASVTLLRNYLPRSAPANVGTFDSRVFVVKTVEQAAEYFTWRRQDAIRNSISMAAQSFFSPKSLHGKKSGQMMGMLASKGARWDQYPAENRFGQWATRRVEEREFTFTRKDTKEEETTLAIRSWWELEAAPEFSAKLLEPLLAPKQSRGEEVGTGLVLRERSDVEP